MGLRLPFRLRGPVLVELTLLALLFVLALVFSVHAHAAWLVGARSLSDATLPPIDEVNSLARRANLAFSIGIAALAAGRVVGAVRGREPLRVPLLVPSAVCACVIGLVVHHATVETAQRTIEGVRQTVVLVPSAAPFAEGFAIGALVAALVMIAPIDPATLASRMKVPIALAILGIFVALAVAGSGPAGSGTRINLGPIQPIEAVKLLFVVFLSAYLGSRAPKLRWHRVRFLGLRWPRPALLLPALFVLVVIFGGLFVVGDLGPVTILAFVFLGMFFLVTRATGWVAVALGLVFGFALLLAKRPELLGVGRVVTRIQMWREPFWNGIAYGDQLGEALWAIAAGGPFGQGLGRANVPLVAAGKTDLVLATLAEQLGVASVLVYVAMIAIVVLSGIYVATRARTAERVLLAGGASILLTCQWAIIYGGTFGSIPLTGVVVPFLSSGRSSMVAFVAIVGILARLAEDGAARVASEELDELHGGARSLGIVTAVVLSLGVMPPTRIGATDRERVSASAISTRLADGSTNVRSNPRLVAMARSLRRGSILDRTGNPIAMSSPDGRRSYPLAAAMGTLVGTHPSEVLLPPWALERILDRRLRGYGDRTDGPTGRAYPDLRPFAELLSLPRDERLMRLSALERNLAARSVTLTIDAELQARVATTLARVARERGHLAVAAVVLDVDTGEVLARAQFPDLDPNDPQWQRSLRAREPGFVERFTGAYGAWPDKTGAAGHFQSGSVGKLFTALAAARRGMTIVGGGCAARGGEVYGCTQRDEIGPFFTRPGWSRPIHDHFRDSIHGRVDLVEAIAVSCNVYFGQLALELGPEPFVALWNAGVDVGFGRSRGFDPGAPGSRQLASTGFGQGAMVMNTVQAARLVAAIGAGGIYRRCAATMELGVPCSEIRLLDDARTLTPVLAGMRAVMTHGTGRALDPPAGVRVYGKTGTADVQGFAGEEPFGLVRGSSAPPHSWFVALAEPLRHGECGAETRGRIAVAVVVPRGGSGAGAAGPIAMEIVAAAMPVVSE